VRGCDEMIDFFGSISASLSNAHTDHVHLDVSHPGQFISINDQAVIALTSIRGEPGVCGIQLKPTASMILFIGWLMTQLPSRATVTWRDGWPHVYCPPNDDREDDTIPHMPIPGDLTIAVRRSSDDG